MKKLILTAVAAMMVLASCTKTTVESIDGPKEIAFKKIEGAMTKAPTELTGTMGVFAYFNRTTTEYFGNASFEKGTTTYWEGDKYWPLNGQALDFVVYAPFMPTTGDTKIGYTDKTLTFTIANNSSIPQIDYLYGSEYYDNNDNDSTNDTNEEGTGFVYNKNGVAVMLKHALAKITVNVNASADNVFTITNITLNNTEQGGTIEVDYDGLTAAADDDASVSSCVASTPGTQDADIEMILFNTDTPVTKAVNVNTTKSCLVFPGNQTSFTIKYEIEGIETEPGIKKELTTTLNLQNTWVSGTHYIYNLTLTANEILFNPQVADWDDEETSAPSI